MSSLAMAILVSAVTPRAAVLVREPVDLPETAARVALVLQPDGGEKAGTLTEIRRVVTGCGLPLSQSVRESSRE